MGGARLEKPQRKRRPGCAVVLLLLLVIAAWLTVDCVYSNTILEKQNITLEFDNLPSEFNGFTIVHLSDLHQRTYGGNNHELLKLVELANPDMIAITGDLIDKPKFLSYAEILCAELIKLAPVYYVTGNHEWGGKAAKELKSALSEMGVSVMDGKYSQIKRFEQTLFVAGLEDPNGRYDRKTAAELVSSVKKQYENAFILMLSHRYERFAEYEAAGIDLVLTGHAHGGLIRLPFTEGLIAPGHVIFPKHTSGAYTEGKTTMVTSRGLAGAGGIVPRMFNRPDIPVITLKTAN